MNKNTFFSSRADSLAKKAMKFIMSSAKSSPHRRIVFKNKFDNVVYFSPPNGIMSESLGAVSWDGLAYFVENSEKIADDYDFWSNPDGIIIESVCLECVNWDFLCKIADSIGGSDTFSCDLKRIIEDAKEALGEIPDNTKISGITIAMQVDCEFQDVPVKYASDKYFVTDEPSVDSIHTYDEVMVDDFLWFVDRIYPRFASIRK